MKIYLDDDRKTPEGYIRTYSVEETIELIAKNNGSVETVSLDNDLGIGFREGREVMKWIEEQAFNNTLLPIPHLIIHSGNNVAADEMKKARNNAWRFWVGHGYSRSEYLQKDY
jgi:hypothetical protein